MHPLRQFRQQQGVEIHWLADKLQVHRVTLSRWEHGKSDMPPSVPFQLAYIFRLPVEDVLALFSKR